MLSSGSRLGGLAHEMFSVGARYEWMSLAFIPGFFVPIPFYLYHRRWPKAGFSNINTNDYSLLLRVFIHRR